MYICEDCELRFDEPKQWDDGTGDFYGCPKCGGAYEELIECNHGTKGSHLVTKEDSYCGWCYECAKEAFTMELAERFLKKEKLEEEFYIEYVLDVDQVITSTNALLILCKNDYCNKLKVDGIEKVQAILKMKDFVFDCMWAWIDFLVEEKID